MNFRSDIYFIITIFLFLYLFFKTPVSNNNSGNTNNSGELNVSGKTNLNSLYTNGGVDISGGLNVSGKTNLNSLYTKGAVDISGGLNARGGTNNNPGGIENPWWTHFPYKGDGNNYIRGNTIMNGDFILDGNMQIGGRSNIKSIFGGNIRGACGSATTVTHNRNYPNPNKLSIQLTCSRLKSEWGDMFVANISENDNGDRSLLVGPNSFTFFTYRLNGSCGSVIDPTVNYVIYEYY
jgi:hypothetical protein